MIQIAPAPLLQVESFIGVTLSVEKLHKRTESNRKSKISILTSDIEGTKITSFVAIGRGIATRGRHTKIVSAIAGKLVPIDCGIKIFAGNTFGRGSCDTHEKYRNVLQAPNVVRTIDVA